MARRHPRRRCRNLRRVPARDRPSGVPATPGNEGAWVLWRRVDDRAEFVTLSLWESREAIVGFAGDDIERAVFYPEDDRSLITRELRVEHYEAEPG
jgi:heme-degrading monooxygenase HmoA